MPRKPWNYQKSIEGAETEPNEATETVVATLSGVSPDNAFPSVLLEGSCNVATGTGTTAVVIRIRRGTTAAGTLIGKALTSTFGESKEIGLGITVLDQPEGELASQSYVMTIQRTAGTGKGKVTGATLTATY